MKNFVLMLVLIVTSQCYASNVPRNRHLTETPVSDLYRTIDVKILRSNNEQEVRKLISEKATIIRELVRIYEGDFSSLTDEEVFVAGAAIAAIEMDNNGKLAGPLVGPGDAFKCLIAAIGAVTGINSLVSTITGASMATVVGVVTTIFRTYFSAFMAAYAVYEFGSCMGWWSDF